MTRRIFSPEFMREAAQLVVVRGVSVAQAPRGLAPSGQIWLCQSACRAMVSRMCDALGMSRSGFHAWLTRPQSARARKDERLGAVVRATLCDLIGPTW